MRPIRMSTLLVPIAIAALSIGLVVKQQRTARREARTTESQDDSSILRLIEAVSVGSGSTGHIARQKSRSSASGCQPQRPARVPP